MAIRMASDCSSSFWIMDDNKAVIYGSERKWLEDLMPNYQVWGILEIFLGKMSLESLTFMYLLFKRLCENEFYLKKNKSTRKRTLWCLRNSIPIPGGQWKEILGSQLSGRLGKQLLQLELEVWKLFVFKKEVNILK